MAARSEEIAESLNKCVNLCDSREGSMLKEGSMFTTNTVQTNYNLDDEDHPV